MSRYDSVYTARFDQQFRESADEVGERLANIKLRRALAEIQRLRAVLCKCAVALGNGSVIGPETSIEFLEIFPLEVHAVVRRLSKEE